MSLFAGTSFLAGSGGKKADNVEELPKRVSPVQQQVSDSVKVATASSSSATGKTTTTVGWSAALRFAPAASRKANKPATSSAPRTTLPAGFSTTTTSVNTSGSSSTTPPLNKALHEVVVSAAPQLYTTVAESASSSASPVDTNGRMIFKPPALTLAPGEVKQEIPVGKKRAAPTGGEGGGKRRRKGKKRGPLYTQPVHQFDPFEPYDPAKPNDLQEWRDYRQARRAEKKEEEEQRRRERAGESGSGSEDSWEEEEEEEVDRRPAPRGFAPPPMLYAPPPESAATAFRPIYPDEDDERPPPPPQPLSAPVPVAQSAEEAYQRRVAMSQMASQAPAFAPPTFAPAARPPAFNPATAFVPPVQEPAAPPPPPPLIPGSEEFERRKLDALEQVKARMAAIEALKPKMGVGGTSSEVGGSSEKENDHEPGGSIAARLMRKMGYEEGKGLGVDGSGIKHALSAEHTNPVVSKKHGKPGRWTQAKNAQGKLVNLNENEREKADRERYGEPSRIVCLSNVVARPEEVDDDLSKEMGEECNNYGIVERVAIHYVQPLPNNPAEIVRIFIVFSGLAGAWKCVKQLDRRFFGGLELRATYFAETRFNSGQKDGPLL